MNMQPLFPLDQAAWSSHHATVYSGHDWPAGTLISVSSQPGGPDKGQRGTFHTAGFAEIGDADAIWHLVEREASRGHNTWVGVGGVRPEARQTGRGKREDVVGIPALVADIDFSEGIHAAGDTNPSAEEAMEWIASLPLEPSLVVASGGGLHVWLVTAELLHPSDPAHAQLLTQHKAWWKELARKRDRNIDAGPLNNPAGILRPAGTWNSNQQKPVSVTRISGARYTAQELTDAFMPVSTETPSASVEKTGSVRPREAALLAGNGDERIGSRFARQVPAGVFAQRVFGAELGRGNSLTFPRPDGQPADGPNARMYASDGVETVTVFSRSVREHLDLEDENHALDSWRMLAIVCGGDFAGAARVLARTEVDGGWSDALFEAARAILNNESPVPLAGAGSTTTIRQALDGSTQASIELENKLIAKIGHGLKSHGLFERVRDNEQWVDRQITSFVAWRSRKVAHMSIDSAAELYEVTEPEYTVEIVDAFGRRKSRQRFSAEDSADPKKVIDRLDIGAVLPYEPINRRKVEAMLRSLGRHDSMEEIEEFHTFGWMRDPVSSTHVFLAPSGSVTASGPTSTYTVSSPANSDDGAGTPAALAVGFPDIPQEQSAIIEAAEAVKAFLQITPTRLDLGSGQLGLILAAPLALTRRTSFFIVAEPGTGKTLLISAGQCFLTGYMGSSFTGGPAVGDSRVSAEVKASWVRHSVLIYDDFYLTNDQRQNEKSRGVVGTVAKLAYGQDGGSGGTVGGGLRATRTADITAIFTGEGTPEGQGVVSRLVHATVKAGEVACEPQGHSPYDRFIRDKSADARALYGAYLQWLAGLIDSIGFAAFRRENDRLKQQWGASFGGRTAETVSVLAVGWLRFREFARHVGFEHLLPEERLVDEALTSLIASNNEVVTEASPARTILTRIAGALVAADGHLEIAGGELPPPELALRLGWRERRVHDRHGERSEWQPSPNRLGFLSRDRKFVVIANEAIARYKNQAGLRDVPADQLTRDAQKFVAPGTVPGARASRELFENRARGWVVPAHIVDLDELVSAPERDEAQTLDVQVGSESLQAVSTSTVSVPKAVEAAGEERWE